MLNLKQHSKHLVIFISFVIGLIVFQLFGSNHSSEDAEYYYRIASIIKNDPSSIFFSPEIGIVESFNAIIQGLIMCLPGNDLINVYIFQIFLFSIIVWILYSLIRSFFNSDLAAWIIVGFTLINHKQLQLITNFKPEIWVWFFVTLLFWLLYQILNNPEKRKNWAWFGLTSGLLLLTDLRYIPHLGTIYLIILFNGRNLKKTFKPVFLSIIILIITISPWILRQSLVFDRFIFISDSNTVLISKILNTKRFRKLKPYSTLMENLSDQEFEDQFWSITDSLNLTPGELIYARNISKIAMYDTITVHPQHEELIRSGRLTREELNGLILKKEKHSELRNRLEYGLHLWEPCRFGYSYKVYSFTNIIITPASLTSNINRLLTVGIWLPFMLLGIFTGFKEKDKFIITIFCGVFWC